MCQRLIIITALLAVAGCSSSPETEEGPQAKARGTGYLEKGPTVVLDEPPPSASNTTLQLLDQRVRENARLKAKIKAIQGDLKGAEERAAEAEGRLNNHGEESKELRGLLERALSQQKDLTDQLLAARIARLKVEQEMLRLKLADQVQESE